MPIPRLGRKIYEKGLIEKEVMETQVITDDLVKTEVEMAADVLMQFLPEDSKRDIVEAAHAMSLPIWQLLLGYAVRCHDSALTYSPFILSAWESGGKPNATRPCRGCNGPFKSRFPDAQYCCNNCAFEKLVEKGHSTDCPLN